MSVRLALLQYASGKNADETLAYAEGLIRKAAGKGASIICLQELFHADYFCREVNSERFREAIRIPGPFTDHFSSLASELNAVLVLPFFEEEAPGIYFNSAAVIDSDGSLAGIYRKMHIPEDPGFHEKFYFTPGDKGYQVFETSVGRIGVLICWDQWFPEAARITSMMDADLLLYPTAIGTLAHESPSEKEEFYDAWKTIQRSHAIANGLFVAAVNRVGTEGGTTFWGRSFVSGPMGQILAEAGEEEEILIADLDFSNIKSQRQIWPFFRDRRIDSYGPITKRWIKE
jgi:N-carbamoylputrescine amidase